MFFFLFFVVVVFFFFFWGGGVGVGGVGSSFEPRGGGFSSKTFRL